MSRGPRKLVIVSILAVLALAGPAIHADRSFAVATQEGGWQLPADAPATANPLPVNDALLSTGKKVFSDKCQKCHGPKGLGDGPDADPEHAEDMNLTNPRRAQRNPDGVVFYKVMNGRRKPKMPAFKDELSREQVWAVVAYAQSLRKK